MLTLSITMDYVKFVTTGPKGFREKYTSERIKIQYQHSGEV